MSSFPWKVLSKVPFVVCLLFAFNPLVLTAVIAPGGLDSISIEDILEDVKSEADSILAPGGLDSISIADILEGVKSEADSILAPGGLDSISIADILEGVKSEADSILKQLVSEPQPVTSDNGDKTVSVCEHETAELSCHANGEIIEVTEALYGRILPGSDICPDPVSGRGLDTNINCGSSADKDLVKIQKQCDGKTTCNVPASNTEFGEPCSETFKYLSISYNCRIPDIDDCDPNPCGNGGTCTDGINSDTCNCDAGYSGLNCETEYTEILLNGHPTSQSSTMDEQRSPSRNAVDGNTNGLFWAHSCIHTLDEERPWWMVDQGASYCVGKVEIYNRVDCCGHRLDGAIVRVGYDSNRNNPICGTVSQAQINANPKIELACNIPGRYVSIELPGKEALNICEVKAYSVECEVSANQRK